MKKIHNALATVLSLSLIVQVPLPAHAQTDTDKVQIVTEEIPKEAKAYARYAMEEYYSSYSQNLTPEEKSKGISGLTLGNGFSLYEKETDGSFTTKNFYYFPVYAGNRIVFVLNVSRDSEWFSNAEGEPKWLKDLENKPGDYRIYVQHTATGTVPNTALKVDADDLNQDETLVPVYPTYSHPNASLYRLYNVNSGEHFYTQDGHEKEVLHQAGWHDEGSGWVAPLIGQEVYRLYNPNSGEHHYTRETVERDYLIDAGWHDEGIGFHSDSNETAPVYRLFNPNAQDAGSHMYTTSKAEADLLEKQGWRSEGIGWYAELEGYSLH